MSLTKLEYQKTWTSETDFPTYEGSENQVRQDMQYHPDAVKEYLNETLLPQLEGEGGAGYIGDSRAGTVAATLDQVYATLEAHAENLKDLAAGESPEAVRAAQVEFTADGWAEQSDTGLFELRILQSQHKRLNSAFGYHLQALGDSVYQSGSWQVVCTGAEYDEDTGDVVLTAENAYAGRITFFGV